MEGNRTIGIVFSGGGVRGAAHAGVLKALEENGIKPNMLSGSSAGALAGALYAANFTPEEILQFFKENSNVLRWQNFSRTKPGILDTEKYVTIFEPWLENHTFESINKDLYICVTDVLKGKVKFYSEGELVHPLLASAAVPGIFSPVEIDDSWYIDGGTMNNFPIEPLIGQCDFLIGSFVSFKGAIEKRHLSSTYKLVSRANELSVLANSKEKFDLFDFLINPPELANYTTFDSSKIEEIYSVGYQYTMKNMDALLMVFDSKNWNPFKK